MQEEEKELLKREKEIERELEEKRRKREGKLKVGKRRNDVVAWSC